MSQFAAALPPSIPLPVITYTPPSWPDPSKRGPIAGPAVPYQPQVFATFYLWWAVLAGIGFVLTLTVIGIPIGVPAALAAVVLKYIFLYKSWNQIQDGYQRTTPGKAVGFCFIPLFNLYWVFIAWLGLVEDMNGYARRYGLPVQPISETLARVWCVLFVVQMVSIIVWPLSMVVEIGALVIAIILLMQIRNMSAAIAQARLNAYAQRA